jgi:pimeloyl-ACP methyl ester carboxylesterase
MIAQEFAVLAPERVDKLVLCCTHPGVAHGLPMPQATIRIFEEAKSLAPEIALRRFVENALGDQPAEEVVEAIYQRRIEHPLDPAGWRAQAAAGATFPGVDETIRQETLIVTGTEDEVVDPGNADILARRIPGARVERLEGAGHLFWWEQPDAFVRIVEEFLG